MDSSRTTAAAPNGRYSRRSDAEADRRLRIAAVVCGVLFLGVVAWLGGSYIMRESAMNGSVPTFEAVSDHEMQLQLSVRKEAGTAGVCTVRSMAADKAVVGQFDFPVPAEGSSWSQVVTLRTTARGVTAELLGCVPRR
ncbi:DUF4307 domain-containing protein [Kitasatospora sp. NPDC051914]|uniref:DUF4307 domain-containing protein n=1 Tax=Kitasatospora sp. NPDC051914 TaxID=3154945 RepID=UPI00341E805D